VGDQQKTSPFMRGVLRVFQSERWFFFMLGMATMMLAILIDVLRGACI